MKEKPPKTNPHYFALMELGTFSIVLSKWTIGWGLETVWLQGYFCCNDICYNQI